MSISVLFVCLGNICRSPTAEGVFRKLIHEAGLQDSVTIDSAGTGDWHIGRAPDPRAIAAAHNRGIDITDLRARQVSPSDFSEFDYILAMDSNNLSDLRHLSQSMDRKGQLCLFLDYAAQGSEKDVPDPYYTEAQGFEEVLDLIDAGSRGLIRAIQQQLVDYA